MTIFSNSLTLAFSLFSVIDFVGAQCFDQYASCSTREIFEVSDPAIYYASAIGLSGTELKSVLNSIIRGHKKYNYGCVWTALAETDADALNPDHVISIYTRNSIARLDRDCGSANKYSLDAWNREHIWPKSHGFPSQGQDAYTDIHHIVPADKSTNTDRSDNDFKSGGVPDDECLGCYEDKFNGGSTWEPPDIVKGQIARMLFYMDTRYDGSDYDESDTPNLTLVDDSTTYPNPSLGFLSDLLQWHCDFPVSDRERLRNDIVQSWQGNRNPFIDYPEFVESIWDYSCGGNPSMPSQPTSNPPTVDPTHKAPISTPTGAFPTVPTYINNPTPGSRSVWINEFHYDNTGSDVDEFVEVGCNGIVDVTGYMVFFYNGNGGGDYNKAELSGICSMDNFIVVPVSAGASIQNGPDGIALVNTKQDIVLEFISYEGSFIATNGPAVGMKSVNIGVSEASSTPEGYSLQLVGSGCESSDFIWQEPALASKGSANVGQAISCLRFPGVLNPRGLFSSVSRKWLWE